MRTGFSLVELSIVLVILGLITGGILAGQSLIRASELRNVTVEYQQYTSAVQSFRDRYMGLPGDMTNATAFWGAAHATPATCITTLGTGTQTCNGNGNGIIGNAGGEGSDPANNERFRFWQQLVNAGLVNGSYTGIGSAGGESQATIGINVPAAKLTNSGWTPVRGSPVTDEANANTFVGRERNVLIIGAQAAANANRPTHEAALKPEEAWGIDLKIDDGKVGVGRVTGRKGLSSCHIWSGTAATAEYNLTNNTIQCSLNIDY